MDPGEMASLHMSHRAVFGKIGSNNRLLPLLWVWCPLLGKSWILHCMLVTDRSALNHQICIILFCRKTSLLFVAFSWPAGVPEMQCCVFRLITSNYRQIWLPRMTFVVPSIVELLLNKTVMWIEDNRKGWKYLFYESHSLILDHGFQDSAPQL